MLNNMFLNNQWVKEEINKYLPINENGNVMIQKPMEHRNSSSERKIHSKTGLPQETRNI